MKLTKWGSPRFFMSPSSSITRSAIYLACIDWKHESVLPIKCLLNICVPWFFDKTSTHCSSLFDLSQGKCWSLHIAQTMKIFGAPPISTSSVKKLEFHRGFRNTSQNKRNLFIAFNNSRIKNSEWALIFLFLFFLLMVFLFLIVRLIIIIFHLFINFRSHLDVKLLFFNTRQYGLVLFISNNLVQDINLNFLSCKLFLHSSQGDLPSLSSSIISFQF